ncbi:UDP-glycosyltransferase 73C1-like [Curcuma longa]|uniref:UDP-glycosyltransferase 73C1-like n=1 Tax=Curcuma longa TaxID=136217 RepID=UPI003D9F2AEB
MEEELHRERPPASHFALVPLLTQGHIIPMLDLAHQLALRGVLVSFITTPLNASRIRHTIDQAEARRLPIRFVELPFPVHEAGLPVGCENFDTLPKTDMYMTFNEACSKLLAPPLELYLEQHRSDLIVSDFCQPWTRGIAERLGVPRLIFYSMCCLALLCTHNIWVHKMLERAGDENEPFAVPGLPEEHVIEVTKAQAPGFFPGPAFAQMDKDVREAEFTADGVIFNTIYDLEPSYVSGYEKAMGKKIWTVGPLLSHSQSVADLATRGRKASIDTERCLAWLDAMMPRSVIYVSFGSLTRVAPTQMMEIGLGLEASGHPFIWVIRSKEDCSPEVEEWLTGGFEARVSSRALLIRGWAPQAVILTHPAVGGVMTHCGWNTILETITAGLPMISWPHFSDQFFNERLIVQVLKVGVAIGVKVPNYIIGMDDIETLVKREQVEERVRTLMGGGPEGEERRKRAAELAEIAKAAMEEGGSSHSNFTQLIEHFSGRRCK